MKYDTYIYIDNEDKPREEIEKIIHSYLDTPHYNAWIEELENFDIPNLYLVHED